MERISRWRRHVTLNFIHEVSSPTANYSTIVRCFMIPWGIIMGALGVHIARFVINNMVYYLPSLLVYIIFAIVIVGGPDLLPPLTMVNGAEELRERLTWSALFVFIHYSYLLLPDMMFKEVYRLQLSAFDIMIIISGICHFDQGDYHFRKFCWYAHCRGEYYRRHPRELLHIMCMYYFQAGAGVGIIWAGVGVYTFKAFFISLVVYTAIQLFIREEETGE